MSALRWGVPFSPPWSAFLNEQKSYSQLQPHIRPELHPAKISINRHPRPRSRLPQNETPGCQLTQRNTRGFRQNIRGRSNDHNRVRHEYLIPQIHVRRRHRHKMVLAASASYIAVPAVLRYALPEASPSLYFGLSLGVTFPLNLIVGIPFYAAVAQKVLH